MLGLISILRQADSPLAAHTTAQGTGFRRFFDAVRNAGDNGATTAMPLQSTNDPRITFQTGLSAIRRQARALLNKTPAQVAQQLPDLVSGLASLVAKFDRETGLGLGAAVNPELSAMAAANDPAGAGQNPLAEQLTGANEGPDALQELVAMMTMIEHMVKTLGVPIQSVTASGPQDAGAASLLAVGMTVGMATAGPTPKADFGVDGAALAGPVAKPGKGALAVLKTAISPNPGTSKAAPGLALKASAPLVSSAATAIAAPTQSLLLGELAARGEVGSAGLEIVLVGSRRPANGIATMPPMATDAAGNARPKIPVATVALPGLGAPANRTSGMAELAQGPRVGGEIPQLPNARPSSRGVAETVVFTRSGQSSNAGAAAVLTGLQTGGVRGIVRRPRNAGARIVEAGVLDGAKAKSAAAGVGLASTQAANTASVPSGQVSASAVKASVAALSGPGPESRAMRTDIVDAADNVLPMDAGLAKMLPELDHQELARPAATQAPGRSRFAAAITAQIRAADVSHGHTRIELVPHGLGGVDIDIATQTDGTLKVTIRAENPAVLNSLRDSGNLLIQAIGTAGGGALNFQEKPLGQDQGGQNSSLATQGPEADEESAAAAQLSPQANVINGGQLDIMT